MKNLYTFIVLFCSMLINTIQSHAQTSLPYTLNFTSDDPTNWADGIAQDGDGGTSDILGLNLQIYTAGSDHTTLYKYPDNTQSTIEWHDNSYYYSNSSSYTGITSGPSVEATNNGVPAMVIKSANSADNFSLISMNLYDWGYTNVISIETYDNGVKKGSVDFTPDPSYNPTSVSQSDLLTPSVFSDIDEIRFFPKSNPIFNLSFNNIELAPAGTLPVSFSSFTANRQNQNIEVKWEVANQSGIEKYEVQRSADGKSFTRVATQNKTTGSVAGTSYHWIDLNPLHGNNFYRIKSTDISGYEKFSAIVKVTSDNGFASLSIYPNPSSGNVVHLQLDHLSAGTYHLQLINSEGKIVTNKDLSLPSGSSNEALDLSRLPKGIYLLRVIAPDHTIVKNSIIH